MFQIVVLKKILESPLDSKEIQPVNPKGNQSWIFIGRTDSETETSILWPFDAKNWLIWKDPDAGKDWRWEAKGTAENEMVAWHHRLDGLEFAQAPGVGDTIQPSDFLSSPSLSQPSIFPSFRVFSKESALRIRWPKYWSFSISSSSEYSGFPLGLTGLISFQSKGLSRIFSSTTVQKHQFFGAQFSLWYNSYIHT